MCSRVDWVMKELGLSSNVTNSCCIMLGKAKLMTSVLCFCGSFSEAGMDDTILPLQGRKWISSIVSW